MNEFLKGNAEDGDFNQYWYSQRTIDTIVGESSVTVAPIALIYCLPCTL